MGSQKLEVRGQKVSRTGVIAGAVVASALASVFIVSAQTSLKPPCNQFTDPSCHPAPPVVTSKASQTVTGDVNVTGKLCVGPAAGQICFGGVGGGSIPNAVSSGTLTVFQTPVDISDKVNVIIGDGKTKINAQQVLTDKTGTDPGALKGILLQVKIKNTRTPAVGAFYADFGSLSYYANHGDVETTDPTTAAEQYGVARSRVVVGGVVTTYQSWSASYTTSYYPYLVGTVGAAVIPTNGASEFWIGNVGESALNSLWGMTADRMRTVSIVGYYR